MSPFWILLELTMTEVASGDNRSYMTCKTQVKSSPPASQHPAFYTSSAFPVAQPTLSLTEKMSIPRTCSPKAQLGGLPTTKGSWLPWGRVAKPFLSVWIPNVPFTISPSLWPVYNRHTWFITKQWLTCIGKRQKDNASNDSNVLPHASVWIQSFLSNGLIKQWIQLY